MTLTIHCEIGPAEGALRRLVSLIEHRGFAVASLDVGAETAERRRVAVRVAPRDADRSLAALGRGIDRLYGVRCIDAAPGAQAA